MPAKATIVFGADTSELNGRLKKSNRQLKSWGSTLVQNAVKIGAVGVASKLVLGTWQLITQQMQEQEKLLAKQKANIGSRAALTNVATTPERAKQLVGIAEETRKDLGLTGDAGEAQAFDIVNKAVSRFGEEAVIQGDVIRQLSDSLLATGQVSTAVETIDAVADRMQAFGEDTSQLGNVLDEIGAGARDSKADFGPFATTLGQMGTLFKTIGNTGTETNAVLKNLGGDSIEKLRTAANSLAGAFIKLEEFEDIKENGGIFRAIELFKDLDDSALLKKLGKKEAFIGFKLIADVIDKAKADVAILESQKGVFTKESLKRFGAGGGGIGIGAARLEATGEGAKEEALGGPNSALALEIAKSFTKLGRLRTLQEGGTGQFVTALGQSLGGEFIGEEHIKRRLEGKTRDELERIAELLRITIEKEIRISRAARGASSIDQRVDGPDLGEGR